MGAVWLAQDERLGRTVAVKQVGLLPGESVTDVARALREARSSAALNDRNVVAVYDAIEEDERIWLVMEYVPGRTLAEMVAAEGPLAPERVAWIGAQVADGLAAAHAQGTVHRDVKPGNVLVADDDLAKISDFGIARTLGDEQLTHSGMMIGTPSYFSPELARGGDPSPAADVWALGVTLYAAVEGRPPYPEDGNALAMLQRIASGAPAPAERAGPLAEPIRRMLDPDPASRWSMADAAHALHRIHQQEGVTTTREQTGAVAPVAPAAPRVTPATPPTARDDPPRRHRPVLLVLGAVLLVLLLGGLALLLGQDQDDSAPTAQDNRTGSTPTPDDTTAPEDGATTDPPPEQTDPDPAPVGGAQGFVVDYYAALPDDTETGWSRLSEDYQAATSYDRYAGFWSTIDAVSVDGTAPAGPGAVDVTLTYTTDGSSEQEVRRIWLERTADGYRITDDEIVDAS